MEAHTGIGAGPIDAIAQWLVTNIGARLVAFSAGVSRPELMRIAHGEGTDEATDRRLRNVFAVCSYMAVADGAGAAHDFLLEPNDELNGRAPAEVLREGVAPQRVWLAAVPTF